MRIEKEKPNTQVITMEEEYQIPGTDIILEAGDKIEVPLRESHLKMIQGKFFDLVSEAYMRGGQEYVIEELQELFEFCETKANYAGLQEVEIVFSNMLDMIYAGQI